MTDLSEYKNKLKKKLRCCRATKKILLEQFSASLSVYLEEHPTPTAEALHTAFGPPEEMALVLMEAVSETEKSKYRSRMILKHIIAGVLVALFLAFTAYVYMIKQQPITIIEYGELIETYDATGEK